MTEPMRRPPLTCEDADALAGAWGLGALGTDEADAVSAHLETCDRPHAALRDASGAGVVLASALERIEPSAGLRDRVMASIGGEATREAPIAIRRPSAGREWWPRALAGLAAATAILLAVWNVQLQGELTDRDARLRDVASALSAGGPVVAVTGTAGGGVLVEGEDGPIFIGAVEPPGEGLLYAMWLIGPDGMPVAVGTFRTDAVGALALAPLERPLEGFTIFAITREQARVDSPTGDPVLSATIQG